MNVTALPTALASIAQPATTFRRGASGLFVPDTRLTPGPIGQTQALLLAQDHSLLWLPEDGASGLGEARGTTPVLLDRPGDVFERLVRSGMPGALNSVTAASPLAA